MKDNFGLYYYPIPANKKIRMYVRENQGVIEFRLHNQDDPQLFEQHGWITHEAARQAAEMYKQQGSKQDFLYLYDFDTALSVLAEENPKLKQ
ncbi:MAG: hypothetical protein R6U22_07010 [Desulfohalobiaceae bacterium]